MEKAEIKQIGDYLKDLEEGLVEWDYRGITTQGHLTELYRIIKRLMDATALVKRQQDHYEYVPILLKNKHLYH